MFLEVKPGYLWWFNFFVSKFTSYRHSKTCMYIHVHSKLTMKKKVEPNAGSEEKMSLAASLLNNSCNHFSMSGLCP